MELRSSSGPSADSLFRIEHQSPPSDVALPDSPQPLKPRFRGRLHQIAFIAWIPAGMVLVAVARTAAAKAAAMVFALSLIALYGTSAAYHRLQWSARARKWMRRLDHSMIYVLIAGTYTPFSLLVLHGAWSIIMLSLVWTGAAVGIGLKIASVDRVMTAARRLNAVAGALYIVLGWLAILTLPQIVRTLPWQGTLLLFLGGIFYTAGAFIFARRKPDPSPAVFGYHEIWHSMVIGGSACHYTVILLAVLTLH
jgi:hemolysin III